MTRLSLLYPLILVGFALVIYAVVEQGGKLHKPPPRMQVEQAAPGMEVEHSALAPSASLFENLRENFEDPLSRLLIQLILIVLVARLCGSQAKYAHQPAWRFVRPESPAIGVVMPPDSIFINTAALARWPGEVERSSRFQRLRALAGKLLKGLNLKTALNHGCTRINPARLCQAKPQPKPDEHEKMSRSTSADASLHREALGVRPACRRFLGWKGAP
jgi:hypothetical protein